MKKYLFPLMALAFATSFCFVSCDKDEETSQTENEKATVSDFIDEYEVTISEGPVVSLFTSETSYSATITIDSMSADAAEVSSIKELALNYGVDLLTDAAGIAKVNFSSSDADLTGTELYNCLQHVYGYVYKGKLYMVCTESASDGRSLYFSSAMPYKKDAGTKGTWDAYFASIDVKNIDFTDINWVNLLSGNSDARQIQFEATRK